MRCKIMVYPHTQTPLRGSVKQFEFVFGKLLDYDDVWISEVCFLMVVDLTAAVCVRSAEDLDITAALTDFNRIL